MEVTLQAKVTPFAQELSIPVVVNFSGAKPGSDFSVQNTTLHFISGTSTYKIKILDDKKKEGLEKIFVSLKDISDPTVEVDNSTILIQIIDDDDPSSAVGKLEIDPNYDGSIRDPEGCRYSSGVTAIPGQFILGLDGYFEEGSVFFDANRNGTLDFLDLNLNGIQDDNEPSEPAALTEIDGSAAFEFDEAFDVDASGMIDDDEGQWVLLAGIDRSTELPLGLRLVAPMGIFVVSPLSTLMAGLMRDHEFDMIGGEARVLAALDLPPVELADLNLPLEGSNGNANAAELFAASAQIQTPLSPQPACYVTSQGPFRSRSLVIRRSRT